MFTLEAEPVTSWVKKPRVVVRAFQAGVQSEKRPWKLIQNRLQKGPGMSNLGPRCPITIGKNHIKAHALV